MVFTAFSISLSVGWVNREIVWAARSRSARVRSSGEILVRYFMASSILPCLRRVSTSLRSTSGLRSFSSNAFL